MDSEPKKLYHPLPVLYVTGVQVRGREGQEGRAGRGDVATASVPAHRPVRVRHLARRDAGRMRCAMPGAWAAHACVVRRLCLVGGAP